MKLLNNVVVDEYVENDGAVLAVGDLVKLTGVITTSLKSGKTSEFICVTLKAEKGKVGGTIFTDNPLFEPMKNLIGATFPGVLYGKVYKKGAYTNVEIFGIEVFDEGGDPAPAPAPATEADAADEAEVCECQEATGEAEKSADEDPKSIFNVCIGMIEDPMLKAIVTEVYTDENIMARFFDAPATERVAYAYRGGLSRMVQESCKIAASLCAYNNLSPIVAIDRDMIMAATLLTNVGRAYIFDMSSGVPQKNKYGVLDDDTNITRDMIRNIVRKVLSNAEKGERARSHDIVNELIHCVDTSKKYWTEGGMSPKTKSAMICASIQSIANTIGLFEKLEPMAKVANDPITSVYTGGPKYFVR